MSAQDREQLERFGIQPRPPCSRTGRSGRAFVTRVIAEMSQVGRGLGRACHRGNHATSRCQVAAKFAGDRLQPQSRRIVIKTRLVILASASPRAMQTHLRYIARDGVTSDGAPGVAYDAQGEHADLHAFEQRGRGDRHQFRFIIAPENAAELEDLHAFTRELMARMRVDVGSRLDWVAVDHWDTDNPHTHVVLRGRHHAGHDLVLGREYTSHGMRFRAGELATQGSVHARTEWDLRECNVSTGVLTGQVVLVFAIAVVGIGIATRWTTAALGFQARLGEPWFTAFDTLVYYPWQLLGSFARKACPVLCATAETSTQCARGSFRIQASTCPCGFEP